MKRNTLLFFMAIALVFTSCSNDSEDDLIIQGDNPEQPDESKLITYDANIKSIMQNSCIACHGSTPRNGAPFSLVNFSQVSTRSGAILSVMSRQSGSASAMPPSGRLPQTTIDLVDQWIQDGLKEN